MKATTIELFLFLAVVILGLAIADSRFVTCGSVVKLRHISSEKYYLKSSPNKLRSGQQVVTLDTVRGDSGANMLWQVSIYHSSSSFQHHTIPHLFTQLYWFTRFERRIILHPAKPVKQSSAERLFGLLTWQQERIYTPMRCPLLFHDTTMK